MSSVRKLIIGLILTCFLFTMPPMFHIYNQPILILGIPMFMFGIIILTLTMVLLTYILYRYESKNEDE